MVKLTKLKQIFVNGYDLLNWWKTRISPGRKLLSPCNAKARYIDGGPDDLETAVYALGDFLAMKTENAEEDESITRSAPKQLYSFEQDAECIYSAFREVYGINLQTIPYMHWWEFQTLFAGLPEKTEIKQRIMYRSIDLRTIKDKDERKRIKKIQEIVALKKKNRRIMTDYEIGDMFA